MKRSLQTTLRHSWQSIALVTLLCMGAALGVSSVLPKQYRSTFTLLITERNAGLDSYTAAKAAERLTMSLNELLKTTAFTDWVYAKLDFQNFPKDGDPLFSGSDAERRKEWQRRITSRIYPSVGQLKISVFDPGREDAQTLATTVAGVLVDHGGDYLGGGNDITLQVIDAPLASTLPARPDILLNTLAAGLMGLALATGFFSLRKERRPVVLHEPVAAEPLLRHMPVQQEDAATQPEHDAADDLPAPHSAGGEPVFWRMP